MNKKHKFDKGEVSGTFLLGILQSFHNLNILPNIGLNLENIKLSPDGWYPFQLFVDALNDIEEKCSSDDIFFQAGKNFIETWYEFGPGKNLIFSGKDWLTLHKTGEGYNTVVRGGTPDEIGKSIEVSVDMDAGIAIYEDVSPFAPAYMRGLFYGGCLLFNDIDYVDVTTITNTYLPNPNFSQTFITVRFHLKNDTIAKSLTDKTLDWPNSTAQITNEEMDSLIWRYKGLEIAYQQELKYNKSINRVLAEAILVGQQNEAELKVLNQELESFSYSISHDLRAPLRAVNGYAQIIEEDYSNLFDAEGKSILNSIMANARKMSTLIDDLLAFSRLGKRKLLTTEVNMHAIVNTVVNAQLEEKSNENFKIEFIIDEIEPAYADASLIKQVWINLISNAIKYSKNKSTIKIKISSTSKGDSVIYSIKDNGVGFDMAYYDELFGVFQRLHSNEEFEGTGIGLAIVQKIINKHNGMVWAESVVNKGSIFSFSLPSISSSITN